MRRTTWLTLLFLLTGATASAEPLIARLLDAVGGAEAWREARFIHTWAVNHHPQARLPYTQEAWIDLEIPRHRIELCNFDMQRVRAYTADSGWGISEGERYDFDESRMSDELAGWRRLVYRKLRLFATEDPEAIVEVSANRLHVTHRGEYLGWLDVDPATGALQAAGVSRNGESHTRFGALREFDGVNWVASGEETGGWRFETMAFHLLDASAAVSFEPASSDPQRCGSTQP